MDFVQLEVDVQLLHYIVAFVAQMLAQMMER